MFGMNLAWWAEAAKRSDPSEKQPDICDLCGKVIKEEDRYYIGVTHITEKFIAWAHTCSSFKCTAWLIGKVAKIKTK